MPCANASLQTFVDWLQQPQQDVFIPIVTANLSKSPPADPSGSSFPCLAVGAVHYHPFRVIGLPTPPGKPQARFASFLYGTLIDTSTQIPSFHISIELFDLIDI